MSKHIKIYPKIRELRKQGLTYHEINQRLGLQIPKSTLNYICKEIVLTPEQIERRTRFLLDLLAKNRQKAIETRRRLQAELESKIMSKNKDFDHLSDREAKVALALLYLGEGSKRSSHRGIYLGSSDPKIISIFLGLMERCYGIQPNEFKCRISYRADQILEDLEDFWSKHTGIMRSNFYMTIPDPRTIGKPTLRSDYKGVCVLTRKGTIIQLELQAIADIIFENMGT